jgi:hypothetical protein
MGGDADDHFGFALVEQALAEVREAGAELSRDVGDEEEEGADRGSAAADMSYTKVR